ncbi:TPA: 4Fe-4S cluster-binding domain-containing protein, partial [Clostridioides difficile]|nr:4Fe-4S cluster-binding domain-containing protein [Clostridioides difficile]
WCYTGFKFEELITDNEKLELLKLIDVLVDGKFEEDKKSLELIFKGSSNQRIIDVQKTLYEKQIVLYE